MIMDKALEYFTTFSEKDSEGLRSMFANNITLRDWEIRVDESLFLGGLQKADFLKVYQADIFFDDQEENCDSASEKVPTGQVVNLKQ